MKLAVALIAILLIGCMPPPDNELLDLSYLTSTTTVATVFIADLAEVEDLDLLSWLQVEFLVRTQDMDEELEGEELIRRGYKTCLGTFEPLTADWFLIQRAAETTLCHEAFMLENRER